MDAQHNHQSVDQSRDTLRVAVVLVAILVIGGAFILLGTNQQTQQNAGSQSGSTLNSGAAQTGRGKSLSLSVSDDVALLEQEVEDTEILSLEEELQDVEAKLNNLVQ